ncbi:DUF2142 domain-containing protein [Leifsonia sp. F6_8S_P_1B]|uniref:DUF2142 domain-containing protein n=1 Tax=Leifsonia williamsii TaxID=3035919 RepID=A0ABT8KAE5_9MICO|nr:DUF2142 domain-containing protein [Leifsonia williamsii]MDN4614424.1 DUF2142 domain-containing protein [Leifsonia williamsii]
MKGDIASTDGSTAARPRFPWRLFAGVFAALFVLLGAWSVATPIYAVPDEPSHTVRATAAAHGQLVGDGKYFQAPGYLYIPGAGSCYWGKLDQTPACVGESPYGGELRRTLSTAGTNSPVYYVWTGLPSLVLTGEPAILAMRLFSAALVATLLAATAVLLRAYRARWALVIPLAAVTPELAFLGGAINPNAVEAAAAGALFAALLVLARRRPSGWLLGFGSVTAVVAAAFVTGGRSLGMLWVLVAAVGVIVLLRRADWHALVRRTSTWVVLGLLAVVCAGQLFWFTRPGNGVQAQLQPTPGSRLTVAQNMLENTFVYLRQLTGQFGTMDVPAPEGVQTFWTALFLALVILPLVLGRGRERWVTAGFTAVWVLVPVVVQVALWRQVGDVWQGRYMLAVLLLTAIAGGLALDARPRSEVAGSGTAAASPGVIAVLRTLLVLLAVGHLAAFVYTLRRYAVTNSSWVDFLLHPQWQPPAGTVALTAIVALMLVCAVVAVWRSLPALFAPSPDQGDTHGGAAVGSAFASGSHKKS